MSQKEKSKDRSVADGKTRCRWPGIDKPHYAHYHDTEWGVPVHDDRLLFEMLILEGAQAGLSWETILNKRAGYKKAYKNFDVKKVARMTDDELAAILKEGDVVRNRLKVYCVPQNARVFMDIQKEFGSFDAYLWAFVGGRPKVNRRKKNAAMPVTSPESDALSKDLKKRGMRFVGPLSMYAYMQAVGLFNDHAPECFLAPGARA